MHPNQMEIDEALAASLLYDSPESSFDDADIARQFQQQEEDNPQISLSDDEKYAKSLQEKELNHSTSLPHDSSSNQQNHVGSSSDPSSSQSFPPNVDIDPDNMTYENQSERSTKDCRRVESINYQLINSARAHGLKINFLAPKIL
ncbi:hypothetical protein EUTSA_v10015271mg, partial [Eutrema salsugineum]